MPTSSQAQLVYAPSSTTVSVTSRRPSHTPYPGLPPVNVLGPEIRGKTHRVHKPEDVRTVTIVIVEPKVGSKDNIHWQAPGGNVQIIDEKPDFRQHAQSKVGSLENLYWSSPGGHVRIENRHLTFRENAKSKVGSLDNISHVPQPSHPRVVSAQPPRQRSQSRELNFQAAKPMTLSRSFEDLYAPPLLQSRLASSKGFYRTTSFGYLAPTKYSKIQSKIGSLDNIHHIPGGGESRIVDEKIPVRKFKKAQSKVGSLENIHHKPGGGNVMIVDVPLRLRPHSKVGSLDNINHQPLGGNVLIVDEPILYKTRAELARAAHG
ncbi:hypothetical protein DFS34DRAFT_50279 [Phlyctochytrium arcticum]|nr:hypothetical protein DFS34DRAFT_50279 [Phlyctochytrium arcticum]